MRKYIQVLISLGILLFILIGTGLVIIYGKGYQINFTHGRPEIAGTGLLVTTSTPDGAQVFVNDHLTTATNNTINLAPGTYRVKIFKDGFFPWEKDLVVQKEVVSKADAWLISKTPKLESVTELGVTSPVVDPSGSKIAFTVASQSAKKNGIYVFTMNSSPILTLQSGLTQIIDDTTDTFSTASLSWSPDGQSLLATIPTTDSRATTTYLLSATGFNTTPKDVTETLSTVLTQWNQDKEDKQHAQIVALPPKLRSVVGDNFTILSWSPDETKILYVASNSATIPQIITPALIGRDPISEQRTIQKGNVYIYDVTEDKNYFIAQDGNPEKLPNLSWIPDNKHLLYQHDKKIDVLEYDGSNTTTVYAGQFLDNFVTAWPSGDSFVILTNLGNSDTTPNLYTVTLK
ncbi:MAG: PEGA domain-containing protein [Patescibacteria group bacterium]|nr:PEGA domain-containing protein [Patescibacteria group bacterium]MDE2589352.1 PEGA domain-containing protein [Patescibacteria group bacterium]